MKDFIEAFNSRIKSPFFGYYLFFLIIKNWKVFFYLFFTDVSALEKFEYFELKTTNSSLIYYPIFFSVISVLIYPWFKYLFSILTQKPIQLKKTLEIELESRILNKKYLLESQRGKLIETQEQNLIAKRKQEIDSMEDEKTQNEPQQEINELKNVNKTTRNESNKIKYEANTFEKIAKMYEKSDEKKAEEYYLKAIHSEKYL